MASLMYIPGPSGLTDPRIRIIQLDTETSVSFPPTVTEVFYDPGITNIPLGAYEAVYGGGQTGLFRYMLLEGTTSIIDTGYIFLSGQDAQGVRDHGGSYGANVEAMNDILDRIDRQTKPYNEVVNVAIGETLNGGAIGGGSYLNTAAKDNNPVELTASSALDYDLDFLIGAGEYSFEVEIRAQLVGFPGGDGEVSIFNIITGVFDTVITFDSTSYETKFFTADRRYVDPVSGVATIKFFGSAFTGGGSYEIDYCDIKTVGNFGYVIQQIGNYQNGGNVKADIAGLNNSDATAANQQEVLDRIGPFSKTGSNTIHEFFRASLRSDLSPPSDIGGSYNPADHSLTSIGEQVQPVLIQEILDILGPFSKSGSNTVHQFLRVMMRDDLSAPTDVGGFYDPGTDSLEALEGSISALPDAAIIQLSCNNALAAIHLDHLLASDVSSPSLPGSVNSVLGRLLEFSAGFLQFTGVALSQAPNDVGGDATAANQLQVLDRIGPFSVAGNNTVYGWLRSVMRDDLSVPSGVGGTYTPGIHSLEAAFGQAGVNLLAITDILGDFSVSNNNTVLGMFQAVARSDIITPTDMGGSYSASQDSLQAIEGKLASGDATAANQQEILDRIGPFQASSLDTIHQYLRIIMRDDLTKPPGIGGSFTPSSDSLEALSTAVSGLNDINPGEVKSEVDQALTDIHLDHLLELSTTSFPGDPGSILGEMLERSGTWRFVAEALEEVGGGFSSVDMREIRFRLQMSGANASPGASSPENLFVTADTVNDKTGYSVDTVNDKTGYSIISNSDKTGYSIVGVLQVLDDLENFDPATQDVDLGRILGSSDAAVRFSESVLSIEVGAAVAGTLSVTEMTTNLSENTSDHYLRRLVMWVTGSLARQAAAIEAYDGASKKLTFETITEAPQAGDVFVIL